MSNTFVSLSSTGSTTEKSAAFSGHGESTTEPFADGQTKFCCSSLVNFNTRSFYQPHTDGLWPSLILCCTGSQKEKGELQSRTKTQSDTNTCTGCDGRVSFGLAVRLLCSSGLCLFVIPAAFTCHSLRSAHTFHPSSHFLCSH